MTTVNGTEIAWTKYIPHVPHLKQHAFLWLNCQEALYGGAAGGGKSDALLMAALQYVDVPGYSAILFRRTYADLSLPEAIMTRSHEWLGKSDAKWNENRKQWTFPSGATLTFAYMDTKNDRFRYQGSAYQYIGFDEVTQFPEVDYRYLFSRLRRPKVPEGSSEEDTRLQEIARGLARVPLRVRAATNPGGDGHRWVKRRFLDKEPDSDDSQDIESAAARIFMPSTLEDNPSLDMSAYEASLRQLDPITQAQLRHGNWEIRQPGMWVFEAEHIAAAVALGMQYDTLRKNGELETPHGGTMATACDYGDFATVILPLWSLERGGVYIPAREVCTSREDLEEIFDTAAPMMASFKNKGKVIWWAEHRYDSSFAQSNRTFVKVAERTLGMHNALKHTGRPNSLPVSFSEYKLLCVRYIRLLLANSFAAMSGSPDKTRVLAISPRNVKLREQLEDYQEDEFGKFQKGNDDAVDALIAGVQPLAKQHRIIIADMQQRAVRGKAPLQPERVDPNKVILRRQQA